MTRAPPTLIASRYRVRKELGRGGMGVVYVVEHVNTGDHLALKLLLSQQGADYSLVERFKREARAPAAIRSEHVVKVTDADVAPELGGAPFLVMELLDGCDLDKLVDHRGALPPQEVVDYLCQVARALDKAHAIGIVHRDLKPENIFLHRREDGTSIIKILDFGIAKVLGGSGGDMTGAKLTGTGAVMGTPLYMSPEQGAGDVSQIGPATDIWALGLVAYRLLTGTAYWQAETMTQLVMEIMVAPMPPPSTRSPSLPSAFDAWFARSNDRNPRHRFRTVGEQMSALASVFGLPPPQVALHPSGSSLPLQNSPSPAISAGSDIGITSEPVSRTLQRRESSARWRLGLAVGSALCGLAVLVAAVVLIVRALHSGGTPTRGAAEGHSSASAGSQVMPPTSVAIPFLSTTAAQPEPPSSQPPSTTDASPPTKLGGRPPVTTVRPASSDEKPPPPPTTKPPKPYNPQAP